MEASKTLRAPAKLNLTLEVLQRRPDGLHGLRSVMVPVDLCDELDFQPAERLRFECDRSELARDNLVERALRALPIAGGLKVRLRKNIPAGAGLGGGSSDAACILLAAAEGDFGKLNGADFLALARSLGSDVPFFLAQTAALVEGTGERVTALGAPPAWHAVIVKPPVAVSTAWAYEQLDSARRPSRPRASSVSLELGEALQRSDFEKVLSLMQNDFHDAIVRANEMIGAAAEMLREAGASHAMLTGSGSCVFALAKTLDDRQALLRGMREREGYEIYSCAFYNAAAWRSAA